MITSRLSDMTSREGFQARCEVAVSHEDVAGTWIKDGVVLTVGPQLEIFSRQKHDVVLQNFSKCNKLYAVIVINYVSTI